MKHSGKDRDWIWVWLDLSIFGAGIILGFVSRYFYQLVMRIIGHE